MEFVVGSWVDDEVVAADVEVVGAFAACAAQESEVRI